MLTSTSTASMFVFTVLGFQLVLGQRNIIRPLNIQILPILPLLLLFLSDHVGCLGELVPAHFVAFGGGESGDAEEGG